MENKEPNSVLVSSFNTTGEEWVVIGNIYQNPELLGEHPKPKDYLIKGLRNIHSVIKNISIKYEYDACARMHIVEVTPLEIFANNQTYIKMEKELTESFEKTYISEVVHFVSEDSLTHVTKPELIN